jgi:hypothetical protein
MLIDVSMPIVAGAVFRLGTPPVEIATRTFYHQSEGEYETVMLYPKFPTYFPKNIANMPY